MTTWINTMRPERRRHILFAGLIAILILAGVGAYLALKPRYQVLFRDLKPRDARVVVAALDQDKISYSYDEETGSVLVPSGDARSMRLKLLEGGLHLQGVVGLELFDQSDLGLTDFAQKVNYQRALQGELARTIMTLDDVDMARVHLTLPESSLFRRDQAHPRASVAIFMQGDHTLSASVVRGIQQLIAASVPDLTPEDVVIVDQRGQLSGGSASATGSAPVAAGASAPGIDDRRGNELAFTAPPTPPHGDTKPAPLRYDVESVPEQIDASDHGLVLETSDGLPLMRVWPLGVGLAGIAVILGVMLLRRRPPVSAMSDASRRILAARLQRLLAEEGNVHVSKK